MILSISWGKVKDTASVTQMYFPTMGSRAARYIVSVSTS